MKGKMYLKRLLAAAVCLGMILLSSMTAVADADSEVDDTVTVGVPTDRCPVFYTEGDEVVGIGADLMRIVAEDAGLTVDLVPIKEDDLKAALDNTEYDLLMPFGSVVDSQAGRAMIVSDNIMQTPFTLVTKGNGHMPPINNLKVGMVESLRAGAETVEKLYPGIDIHMYDTMDDSVKALRAGEVDALLHNSFVWSYVLQKPAYSDLEVQPTAVFAMNFRAGALDNSRGRNIINRLNRGIAQLDETQVSAVVLSYTSRRLYRYDISDYFHEYGVLLILLAVVTCFLVGLIIQRWRLMHIKHEQKMQELIDRDPLTGLLSLNGFRKRARDIILEHPKVTYLIAYNNIRNFKFINDSLGMSAGDDLLKFWADRTISNLSEIETACRVDADHIAVLRIVKGDVLIMQDKKNVVDPVTNFFIDLGKENSVQICSGLYMLTPEDYKNPDIDHMLDCARVAEKRVKHTKKEGYAFYNPDQWHFGKRSVDLCGHLPAAIRNGELQVWYQPQVDYRQKKITGAEALCRWQHESMGWISPGEFIPMLEEAGLIFELDCFVWEQVCRDLKRWNEAGMRRKISVNLSRGDIREDRDVPKHFYDLIKKYDLSPGQLHIEITETAFAETPELLLEATQRLRDYGFSVEMDDFGSGFSSLHMLKEVKVDRIKLDMDFLAGSEDNERGRVVVKHVIEMVNALGMEIIAEGVEDEEQAAFLDGLDCRDMQGYFFHKPMPVADFEKL